MTFKNLDTGARDLEQEAALKLMKKNIEMAALGRFMIFCKLAPQAEAIDPILTRKVYDACCVFLKTTQTRDMLRFIIKEHIKANLQGLETIVAATYLETDRVMREQAAILDEHFPAFQAAATKGEELASQLGTQTTSGL